MRKNIHIHIHRAGVVTKARDKATHDDTKEGLRHTIDLLHEEIERLNDKGVTVPPRLRQQLDEAVKKYDAMMKSAKDANPLHEKVKKLQRELEAAENSDGPNAEKVSRLRKELKEAKEAWSRGTKDEKPCSCGGHTKDTDESAKYKGHSIGKFNGKWKIYAVPRGSSLDEKKFNTLEEAKRAIDADGF